MKGRRRKEWEREWVRGKDIINEEGGELNAWICVTTKRERRVGKKTECNCLCNSNDDTIVAMRAMHLVNYVTILSHWPFASPSHLIRITSNQTITSELDTISSLQVSLNVPNHHSINSYGDIMHHLRHETDRRDRRRKVMLCIHFETQFWSGCNQVFLFVS